MITRKPTNGIYVGNVKMATMHLLVFESMITY